MMNAFQGFGSMLVVTRRKGQRIIIGNDIEVIVSGISGSTVRLAVVAPRNVPVLRGEVFETVREMNQAALGAELDTDFSFGEAVVEESPSEEDGVNSLAPSRVSPPSGKRP